MGNHEDMLLEYMNNVDRNWFNNGYMETIKSYDGDWDAFSDDISWMEKLPLYHEDDNFIYVHAGINTSVKTMKEQKRFTLLWTREPFIYAYKPYYKKIVFGHTPTMFLNQGSMPVYTQTGNVDIDTGCVYGGALTALVIQDGKIKEFYQIEKESDINEKK